MVSIDFTFVPIVFISNYFSVMAMQLPDYVEPCQGQVRLWMVLCNIGHLFAQLERFMARCLLQLNSCPDGIRTHCTTMQESISMMLGSMFLERPRFSYVPFQCIRSEGTLYRSTRSMMMLLLVVVCSQKIPAHIYVSYVSTPFVSEASQPDHY